MVMYSGGKDSLCLLDLCVRRYKTVIPVHRYFMPGLDYTEAIVAYPKARYGLDTLQIQDPVLLDLIKRGLFRRFPRPHIKTLSFEDLEDSLRAKTGLTWIGYGLRAQESLERNAMLKRDWPYGLNVKRHKFAPLAWWSPKHIKAYMALRRLPLPPSHSGKWNDRSGIGLKCDELAWLRTFWPADYERIIKVFPLAAYQADRYEEIKVAEQERNDRVRAERKAAKESRGQEETLAQD